MSVFGALPNGTQGRITSAWEGLRRIVPAALDSVLAVPINRYYNHCARVIDAYVDGLKHGTRDFTARVYKGHRQVVDKTKWRGHLHLQS